MKVAVVGAGHVGLVTAAALASLEHDVVCMDVDEERIADLRGGRAPFHESGLDDLMRRGMERARLAFTTSMAEAVEAAEAVFVCVGRPSVGAGDRNLSAVETCVREIAQHVAEGAAVVVKSTVPPGTSDRVAEVLARERPGVAVSVVSSPEFLREGHAIEDTLTPARLVFGCRDAHGARVMEQVYGDVLDRGVTVFGTDPRTAELSKLASNAFLATKVSFANALARVSERSGADVDAVAAIMGADPRIGRTFLSAGLGFGGYCLPKDLATLHRVAEGLGYDFGLLDEVRRINEEAVATVARRIEEALWTLEGKTVALFGLAFKPGTDDVRGAPALALADRLATEGARLVAFDPMVAGDVSSALDPVELRADPYVAAEGAHCVVLCTEWPRFLDLDLGRLRAVMAQPVLVDGRNFLDGAALRDAGFRYLPVGRPPLDPSDPAPGPQA